MSESNSPKKTEMIAGGASFAPRRWSLAEEAQVAEGDRPGPAAVQEVDGQRDERGRQSEEG